MSTRKLSITEFPPVGAPCLALTRSIAFLPHSEGGFQGARTVSDFALASPFLRTNSLVVNWAMPMSL
uniref:Apt1 n=1 Tax=Arundo donax TaxID=35708 RepID=A0A0A9FCS2_ARUDO